MTETVMSKKGLFYAHVLKALLAQIGVNRATIVPVGVGARHLSIGVRLTDPTYLERVQKLAEQFALLARIRHCIVSRELGLIVFQAELPQSYWQTITRDNIAALHLPQNTVGLAENRTGVLFDFDDAPHALFAGTTGSGKTEAVRSALVGMASAYKPDQLQMVICDPNSDYHDDFHNLAHLALPVAVKAQDIQDALSWTYSQLIYRTAENIRDAWPILVVVDEADSDIALKHPANAQIARHIATTGRKYRVHLLVATPKPKHSDMPGILDNLLNRFVGLVSDANVSYQLTGKAGLAAHLLTGKGDFLHCVGPEVKRFQVAMTTTRDYDALPRAEVKPVSITPTDIAPLPASDSLAVGRPKNELNAKLLALYLFTQNRYSVRQAKSQLGISYGMHKLHRDFTAEVITHLKWLRRHAR